MRGSRVSLAEESVLLGIGPSAGRLRPTADHAVAAALLLELRHEGRLVVSGEGRSTRVTVSDPAPLGDPELDAALERLSADGPGQKVISSIVLLPGAERLVSRLKAEGRVEEENQKKLGLLRVRRLRATPASGRDVLVSRVRGVLMGEAVPDPRTALLVAVLHGFVDMKLVVPKPEAREAERCAGEIGDKLGGEERALLSAVLFDMTRGDDFASST